MDLLSVTSWPKLPWVTCTLKPEDKDAACGNPGGRIPDAGRSWVKALRRAGTWPFPGTASPGLAWPARSEQRDSGCTGVEWQAGDRSHRTQEGSKFCATRNKSFGEF